MPTRTLLASLLLSTLLLAGCKTGLPATQGKHWTVDSLPERMVKRFTGYRPDLHGNFRDFQYRKKKHVNLTLRRHFLNNSPDNPFEANDPALTQPRPPHSIAPQWLPGTPYFPYYMHAEGLFIGLATLGIWGTFVPLPIESLYATFYGGGGEFWRGFTGGSSTATSPPGVSKFRVKNR
jgi:hypothetical protein